MNHFYFYLSKRFSYVYYVIAKKKSPGFWLNLKLRKYVAKCLKILKIERRKKKKKKKATWERWMIYYIRYKIKDNCVLDFDIKIAIIFFCCMKKKKMVWKILRLKLLFLKIILIPCCCFVLPRPNIYRLVPWGVFCWIHIFTYKFWWNKAKLHRQQQQKGFKNRIILKKNFEKGKRLSKN